jgi:hypothetical protein
MAGRAPGTRRQLRRPHPHGDHYRSRLTAGLQTSAKAHYPNASARARATRYATADIARRLYGGRWPFSQGDGSQKWEPTCSAAFGLSATQSDSSRRSRAPSSAQSDAVRRLEAPWNSLTRKKSLVQIQYGPPGISCSWPFQVAPCGPTARANAVSMHRSASPSLPGRLTGAGFQSAGLGGGWVWLTRVGP